MTQTVLITGANGGLGRALVEQATAAGYRTVALVRDTRSAEALALALPEAHRCQIATCDLSRPENIPAQSPSLGLEQVDVLINNAGAIRPAPLEDADLTVAEAIFAVNYFSPLALTQAVLPGMRQRRSGAVINISSLSAHAGLVTDGVYAASKAALERSAESLLGEVAPWNITVTNVVLGKVDTTFGPPYGNTVDDGAYGSLLEHLAGQSNGDPGITPGEVAEAIFSAVAGNALPLTLAVGDQAREVLDQLRTLRGPERTRWIDEISASGWWRRQPGDT